MRARPNSRPVLSDDEITTAMQAKSADPGEIADVIASRRAAREEGESAYAAGATRSRNDRDVLDRAKALQAELAAEAEEAAQARAKGDGPTKEETEAARMAGLAERTHNGVRWADMPVLHLLNAAKKHGSPEMEAYAEWKRRHR